MTTTTPEHTDNVVPTSVNESSSNPQALSLSKQQSQDEQDIRSASPTHPMEPPGIPRNSPPSDQPRTSRSQSPSVSPPSGTPVPAPQRTQNADDDQRNLTQDPQIVALKAMFPDFDDAILHSVLASVNGNQDQAVDLLLGMSDPNFKSEVPPQPPQPPMTQEELDEQLARRLMLEEQEQHQRWQHQQRPPSSRRSPRPYGGQQAVNQPPPPAAGTTAGSGAEFHEQFTKIAESGKKTFGAFMSKVKAKIQEFQEPNNSTSGGVQPTWGSQSPANYYDPNAQQVPPPQTNYQPYHGHYHHAAKLTGQNQPSPQDSNPRESPSNPTSSPQLVQSSPKTASLVVEGYDGTPLHSSTGVAPTETTSLRTKPASTAGAFGANPTASVPSSPPRGPSPPNPIDGGKLGLLPKKPISLIRDPGQNQPQPLQRRSSDDYDDLEYAENPFEEGRK